MLAPTRLRAVRAVAAALPLTLLALPEVAEPAVVVGSVPAASFAARDHVGIVRLKAPSSVVVVRLRLRCGMGTTAQLTVDKQTLIRRKVRSRRFREVRVAFVAPTGRHRVVLTSRGGSGPRCRRPLGTGSVRFVSGASSAAPGPVVGEGSPSSGDRTSDGSSSTAPNGTSPAPLTTPSTPTPVAPTRPKLAWAPPTMSAPITIAVAGGDQRLGLDTAKDYIVKIGNHAGGVMLSGGRNVTIIGGRIAPPASSSVAVGLGLSGAVGTVHVEGVSFDGSSGHEFDAIQIAAPKATVQLENIRAIGLRGSYDTNHTDVVQPWGGVAKLRVDRLTATTNYQGIFNQPDQGPIGTVDLRHVDLAYDNVGARTGGYLLWLTNGCTAAQTTLSEVYVKGRPGATLGTTVWPPTGQATGCPGVLSGSAFIGWPSLPIAGAARWGTPAGGSFVLTGDVGVAYRSPGYG
jgi:hypothetical protein